MLQSCESTCNVSTPAITIPDELTRPVDIPVYENKELVKDYIMRLIITIDAMNGDRQVIRKSFN